ncbi:3-(methylthio)propionyl-CoA ligase [Rhodovibrionaceae bacterium A322]
MLGLMQDRPLMISSLLTHAAKHHSDAEIITRTTEGSIHRYSYADAEKRARRLVRVLQKLGIEDGDRVGTLAWNNYRHFELYYAVSGMGSVVHTINPRLFPEQLTYIINHAEDKIIFVDNTFAPLIAALAPAIAGNVKAVVMMTDEAHMPSISLPDGMELLCYETLMEAADDDYVWPEFDENKASALCYTSGTTGNPKGVLYSHRSTILHAYAVNMPDAMGLTSRQRVLPVVPMFHVNAWGIPYAAPMVGATLVMPGPGLDGPSLQEMMDQEKVTFAAGVPTIWLGLLQHLRSSGTRIDTVKSLVVGGSACPEMLMEAFESEYDAHIYHAWGMTEMSPIGTYNTPKGKHQNQTAAERRQQELNQGRIVYGVDMKIVDDNGKELPWDGVAFGALYVKGPWVCNDYFKLEGSAGSHDAEGWFDTGDVAKITPDGYMEITDRTKDVIKSGGEWISSIELENIAVSHPKVAEAAVIAAHHPKWDERPLLIVRLADGESLEEAEMLSFYDGKVAKWWIPNGVVVTEELPHTATGKLLKTALRDTYGNHYLDNAD